MDWKRILNLVSVYAPQAGRPMAEKEEFLVLLNEVVVSIKEGEGLFICGDFNGHVGEKADGFEGVHCGKGFGGRNPGEMVL